MTKSNVVKLPKVHRKYFENPSVQMMLMMGLTIADVLEVHGELFGALAKECPDDNALIGDVVSEQRARKILISVLDAKLESMTGRERDRTARRAAFFKEIPLAKVKRWAPLDWERAAAKAEQQADSRRDVTVNAATRRFNRVVHEDRQRISKLKGREKVSVGGTFALIDARNVVRDSGEIDAVERWCREAGVLRTGEMLRI
ncbi:hypothetical protein [Bradyrhizobium sp. BWC-3-1]|uniref:hypothetical protein n=1 Tax=Bradyrhizobium sp. BWC-3-1 TaxID=3080012 RepID=UPI00293E6D15|nr:hypothetical protein [Bradyrhizobium sp. BWC-3-1]WOH59470.1 hypothetical protein RX329_04915 [Bradyrhizobium sp. BWC-3-1]